VFHNEFLVIELCAVDAHAARALHIVSFATSIRKQVYSIWEPYIATGKVATLEHEVGDDAVEARASIGKFLAVIGHEAFAKLAEVLGSYGSDVIVEVEVDPASLV